MVGAFSSTRKIVVSIICQKHVYYRTRRGRWANALKKAREFASAAEAQQEADRIGAVIFLGEPCQPQVFFCDKL